MTALKTGSTVEEMVYRCADDGLELHRTDLKSGKILYLCDNCGSVFVIWIGATGVSY